MTRALNLFLPILLTISCGGAATENASTLPQEGPQVVEATESGVDSTESITMTIAREDPGFIAETDRGECHPTLSACGEDCGVISLDIGGASYFCMVGADVVTFCIGEVCCGGSVDDGMFKASCETPELNVDAEIPTRGEPTSASQSLNMRGLWVVFSLAAWDFRYCSPQNPDACEGWRRASQY